jgi:hypothetical protein
MSIRSAPELTLANDPSGCKGIAVDGIRKGTNRFAKRGRQAIGLPNSPRRSPWLIGFYSANLLHLGRRHRGLLTAAETDGFGSAADLSDRVVSLNRD